MSSQRPKTAPDPRERSEHAARPYRQPRLERLGDLRGLTLGSSPGIPDSGIGLTQQQQP